MRISDWSSDVCSSDLRALHHRRLFRATHLHHHKSRTPTAWAAYSFSAWEGVAEAAFMPIFLLGVSLAGVVYIDFAIFIFLAWMIIRNVMGHAGIELHPAGWEIGRASCREGVCQYV